MGRARWFSWADFLGYLEREAPPEGYLSYQAARAVVRAAGVRTKTQWLQWLKRGDKHPHVPREPDWVYRHQGWHGWRDFLGEVGSDSLQPRSGRAKNKTTRQLTRAAHVCTLYLCNGM